MLPLSETSSEILSIVHLPTEFPTKFPTKTERADGDAKHIPEGGEGRGEEGLLARITALRKHESPLSPTLSPARSGGEGVRWGSARMRPNRSRS